MKHKIHQPENQTCGTNKIGAQQIPPILKWKRVLTAFLSGQSYNRFEAEQLLHDHCLHSTVSDLEEKGVRISREWETVAGYEELPTRVMRYWLAPDSQACALSLLGKQET